MTGRVLLWIYEGHRHLVSLPWRATDHIQEGKIVYHISAGQLKDVLLCNFSPQLEIKGTQNHFWGRLYVVAVLWGSCLQSQCFNLNDGTTRATRIWDILPTLFTKCCLQESCVTLPYCYFVDFLSLAPIKCYVWTHVNGKIDKWSLLYDGWIARETQDTLETVFCTTKNQPYDVTYACSN